MKIKINGKELQTAAADISGLAAELGLPEKGTAIAMNGRMVPKAQWDKTMLEEGAAVIIIRASCGG